MDLDVSGLSRLEVLWITDNRLKEIDMEKCKLLKDLHVGGNQLSRTPTLPNSLDRLNISGNPLEELSTTSIKSLITKDEMYKFSYPNWRTLKQPLNDYYSQSAISCSTTIPLSYTQTLVLE